MLIPPHSGQNTSQMAHRFQQYLETSRPALVMVMAGVKEPSGKRRPGLLLPSSGNAVFLGIARALRGEAPGVGAVTLYSIPDKGRVAAKAPAIPRAIPGSSGRAARPTPPGGTTRVPTTKRQGRSLYIAASPSAAPWAVFSSESSGSSGPCSKPINGWSD